MGIKVGNASISEKGTITGIAGDQTGKEVYTRSWYERSEGWVTLRCIVPGMAEFIAEAMEKACKNDDIGYDQYQNGTLWENVKPYGYDPSKTTKKVETDCARLIRVCVQYACVKMGMDIVIPDFYTATLANVLVKTGLFEKLTDDKYNKQDKYLLRGDVQVTKTKGHAWCVLENGAKAEPVTAPAPVPEKVAAGNKVKITGGSVNIRTGPGTEYTVIHTAHKGDEFALPDTDGWLPIKWGGHVYWVSQKHADAVKEV